MTIKNILRVITLLPLLIYLIYCSYHVITNEIRPTYVDCGIVVSKSSDEVAIKYGTETELYLNVQFNKSGFRSIECDPTTYFSKKIGQDVCFNLSKDMSTWYEVNYLVGLCVLVVLGVTALVCFIIYLMPDSWNEGY